MVSIRTPTTLVKVGKFDGDLEKTVKKFNPNMTKIPFGLGNVIKYGLFKEDEEPYWLIISQQKEKKLTYYGYNVILSVTSYSEERNKQISKEFENSTEIDLNIKVPDFLKENTEFLDMGFQIFEKNPKEAMEALLSL